MMEVCSYCQQIHSIYAYCPGITPAPPLGIPIPAPDGVKHDAGKLRWSLLPFRSLEPVVRVLMAGSRKYADDNWKVVPNSPSRYLDACFRHLTAHAMGEPLDPETGEPHLAHALSLIHI